MSSYPKRNVSVSDSDGNSSESEEFYESKPEQKRIKNNVLNSMGKTSYRRASAWTDMQDRDAMEEYLEKKPKRQPKCFSRNALMARENRLKKKLYIQNLEKEVSSLKGDNKNLVGVVENQSFLISELKKEVKYLKSVLANSSDISRLIRNINQGTGMSVTTSLNEHLTFKNNYVSKQCVPVARKTAHPWEEDIREEHIKFPSSPDSYSLSPETVGSDDIDSLITEDILKNPYQAFTAGKPLVDLDIPEEDSYNLPFNPHPAEDCMKSAPQQEHNYTFPQEDVEDGVGICLHVSNHKVSLEFCPTCSENAAAAWQKIN